ncbi:MAG: AMP-binding protein [Alicyclobacillaceae bacterium]|nr:AMP-binding protein [Alicyclobacillaceae bacterium]
MFLDKLDSTIAAAPDRLAVVDVGAGPQPVRLTYGELGELADRIATRLLELGVEPGEPVCYQLPSGWEFIALTVALWRIGGVPCPLLPSLREREVRFIVQTAGSRLLVVPDMFRGFDYRGLVDAIRPDLPRLASVHVVEWGQRQPSRSSLGGLVAEREDRQAVRARRPGADDVAQLLFTSGTTGEPKGVLHTHRTLSHGLAAHVQTLGLTASDTVWVPSPLAHQTGFLYGMMLSFYLGATGVYQAVWNVEDACRAIETFGARFVQAAMPFLADITHALRPPKGLRLFVATGAAIPRGLALEARAALGCEVVGAWGSTESCLVTVGYPGDPPEKLWGTDGRVIGGMEIRIVDDEGRPLPPGTEGNFQVKTPAMFIGYLHHPEWTQAAMTPDGFFNTGDLAVVDADGYLRITGRCKDVINRGGEKIPVVEIENLLYQHPRIRDAAVVAMPDPRLGERACAFVVTKDGGLMELAELTDFLGANGMAKIYWPERVEPIDELPRTASGKVQKYVLRQMIADKLKAEAEAGAPAPPA